MKSKVAVVVLSLLSYSSVFAGGTYTETGYGDGLQSECSGDQFSECESAKWSAQALALEDCYAAGNKTCIVTEYHYTDVAGGCSLRINMGFCSAEATVVGN